MLTDAQAAYIDGMQIALIVIAVLGAVLTMLFMPGRTRTIAEAPSPRRYRHEPPCTHPLSIQLPMYSHWVETLTNGQGLARFGHALSDATRARLLLALRDGPGYPAELAATLGVTRQNLSNHLACLRGCGLVVAAPEGRRTRYELADARIAHALGDLLGLVLAVDPAACADSDEQGCC